MTAVDAHVHVWDLEHVALPWYRPELGLPEAALPRELAAAAAGAVTPLGPVGSAIAVQAADTRAEAHWLLALQHPVLAGVVLQFDPADGTGEAAALVADSITSAGAARGVRVAVPARRADLADVPRLDALCEQLAEAGGVVEFLVRPEQLPAVAALAGRHPRAAIVVCHLGLGAAAPDEEWASALGAVAARPNTAAKVSGVVTDGAVADGAVADGADPAAADGRLARVLRTAFDAFGAGRLLFGSDWPMSARVAPYELIVARTAAALPRLTVEGEAAFWGGTARALYRL